MKINIFMLGKKKFDTIFPKFHSESFRNEESKPRQRTVCTLGRLEAGGEVDTLIASLL